MSNIFWKKSAPLKYLVVQDGGREIVPPSFDLKTGPSTTVVQTSENAARSENKCHKGAVCCSDEIKVPQQAPTVWGKERERGGGEVVQGIEREYDSVCYR